MILIGLTGGIGCGKSTASRFIENELKIPVVDADKIARTCVEPGQVAYNKLIKAFGTDIIDDSGHIDRVKLGKIAFSTESNRKLLNHCTHPSIRFTIFKNILYHYLSGVSLVILDAPLLIESKLHRFCNKVIVMYCDEDTQKQRILKRNPELSTEDIHNRIKSQMPVHEKLKYATFVVDNTGELSDTLTKVSEILEKSTPSTFVTVIWWLFPWLALFSVGYLLLR